MTDTTLQEARLKIFSKIAQAKRTGKLPDSAPSLPTKPLSESLGQNDLVERFSNELRLLNCDVFIEKSSESVREKLQSFIDGKTVLSWDKDLLPYDAGSILESDKTTYEHNDITHQEKAEIGLTGCEYALAETGSLILLQQKGKHRTLSLLPPVHIALVQPSKILYGLGDFFTHHQKEFTSTHYSVIATGQSATADIEMIKIQGVHGPGKVIIIIGP